MITVNEFMTFDLFIKYCHDIKVELLKQEERRSHNGYIREFIKILYEQDFLINDIMMAVEVTFMRGEKWTRKFVECEMMQYMEN